MPRPWSLGKPWKWLPSSCMFLHIRSQGSQGGARRSQEEPGGARGEPRGSQEEPEGGRTSRFLVPAPSRPDLAMTWQHYLTELAMSCRNPPARAANRHKRPEPTSGGKQNETWKISFGTHVVAHPEIPQTTPETNCTLLGRAPKTIPNTQNHNTYISIYIYI